MDYTQNYQLNQWEASDRVLRIDFNSDNAKIDAALKTSADAIAALEAALEGKADAGDVSRVIHGSFSGTGSTGLRHLAFGGGRPKMVMVRAYEKPAGSSDYTGVLITDIACVLFRNNGVELRDTGDPGSLENDGFSIDSYNDPDGRLNQKGAVYTCWALM